MNTVTEVVNVIANPKGWRYEKRKSTTEREFGYHFISVANGRKYHQRIKADNPIDAANRLRHIDSVVNEFKVFDNPAK